MIFIEIKGWHVSNQMTVFINHFSLQSNRSCIHSIYVFPLSLICFIVIHDFLFARRCHSHCQSGEKLELVGRTTNNFLIYTIHTLSLYNKWMRFCLSNAHNFCTRDTWPLTQKGVFIDIRKTDVHIFCGQFSVLNTIPCGVFVRCCFFSPNFKCLFHLQHERFCNDIIIESF